MMNWLGLAKRPFQSASVALSWFTPDQEDKDLRILKAFIETYCGHHHGTEKGGLCEECAALYAYAEQRRLHCPYDPKPACKNCATHCYAQRHRARIKEVMKFSGMHFIKRGRIDWLLNYYLS